MLFSYLPFPNTHPRKERILFLNGDKMLFTIILLLVLRHMESQFALTLEGCLLLSPIGGYLLLSLTGLSLRGHRGDGHILNLQCWRWSMKNCWCWRCYADGRIARRMLYHRARIFGNSIAWVSRTHRVFSEASKQNIWNMTNKKQQHKIIGI